jgi:hypothetical protein
VTLDDVDASPSLAVFVPLDRDPVSDVLGAETEPRAQPAGANGLQADHADTANRAFVDDLRAKLVGNEVLRYRRVNPVADEKATANLCS